MRDASPLQPGLTIGRYTLLRLLGAGGMGAVYAAYDPSLDRRIALKVLLDPKYGTGPVELAQRRLLREAQAMAKLDHPNVISVHDVGTYEGGVFVAMEFVRGSTLSAWLDAKTRPWHEILPMFVEAGRGLAAAHAVDLVHRDFKPDNVMVGDDNRVRVLDFGLVRAAGDGTGGQTNEPPVSPRDRIRQSLAQRGVLSAQRTQAGLEVDGVGSAPTLPGGQETPTTHSPAIDSPAIERALDAELTREGAVMGTPPFMPPEAWRGSVSGATGDQFSFCVALYRALYGEAPFDGDAIPALADNVMHGRLRPLPSSEVPARLSPVVRRGLATEPEERWPSMDLLLDALRPPARRSKLPAVAVATSLASVAAVLWVADASPAPCQSAAARWDGVDDEAQRLSIKRAYAGEQPAFVAVSLQHTLDAVDRYQAQWLQTHTDACEATRVRHEYSERALDARMGCLDLGLAQASVLMTLLAEGDTALVANAPEAAARLSDPSECLARTGRQLVDPPADAQAKAVAELRLDLREAVVLEALGAYARSAELAARLVERATALDYRPATAEVRLAYGIALDRDGKSGEASAALALAAIDARASNHLAVAARAESRLVYVLGYREGKIDQGLAWAEQARAEVDRYDPDGPVAADLQNNRGTVLFAAGRRDEAIAATRAALQMRRRLLGETHPDVSESLNNLGAQLRVAGHLDEALATLTEALALREAELGPDHPIVARVLVGLANTLAVQRNTEHARETFVRALQIRERALGPEHPDLVRPLIGLSAVLSRLGQSDAAVAHQARALTISAAHWGDDHPLTVKVRRNLGALARAGKDHASAYAHFSAAAGAMERTRGPEHPELPFALTDTGDALLGLGRPQDAALVLERAVALLRGVAHQGRHGERGRALFALAQALWPNDPRRAREHAAGAAEAYAAAGDDHEETADAVLRWSDEHAPHTSAEGEPPR